MTDEVKNEVTEEPDVEGQRLPHGVPSRASRSSAPHAEAEIAMSDDDDDVEGQSMRRRAS